MSLSKCCDPSIDGFPEDMINEILLRLPVKSILRFRAVSKSWCSLLSSNSFVKSHLSLAIKSPGANELVFHSFAENSDSISFLNLGSCHLVANIQFSRSESGLPFVPDSLLVGSARGIVCVTIVTEDPEQHWLSLSRGKQRTSTYICNPATKKYKRIPPPNIRHDTLDVGLGFGFDPIDNDFKVVRVVNFPLAVEVYSATMNVWRNVGSKPNDVPNFNDYSPCVNGFLCWIEDDGIEAFDLNKEVFTCNIKLPDRSNHPCITDFNDSIAVIIGEGFSGKINLWTLDDVGCFLGGGVEASWTLMLSIVADLPVHFVHSYFNSGVLLISDGNVWFSYNSYKKVAKKVPVSLIWGQIFKYTESLISIT